MLLCLVAVNDAPLFRYDPIGRRIEKGVPVLPLLATGD